MCSDSALLSVCFASAVAWRSMLSLIRNQVLGGDQTNPQRGRVEVEVVNFNKLKFLVLLLFVLVLFLICYVFCSVSQVSLCYQSLLRVSSEERILMLKFQQLKL
uniref:Uncharacterized protein n=1 Tax=Cacopsylla melanoneura TaxID=428564 RepID=A0A8D8ZQL6_9HEMI